MESENFELRGSDLRWMRDLARRLLADSGLAEDVVQEAMLVAHRRRSDIRGTWSSFVAGVIRKLAFQTNRSSQRRKRREAQFLPEGSDDDVAHLAARVEWMRKTSALLLALDEPYRSTLLLRFVEDAKPAAIAEKLGIPVATVNSRIARGLDRLRERLDVDSRGDRTTWQRALIPLAFPSGRIALWTIGGVMKGKVSVALVALLIVACVATLWIRDSDPARLEADTASAAKPNPSLERVAATEGPTERLVLGGEGAGSETVAESVDVEVNHVTVRVVRAENHAPIEGAVLVPDAASGSASDIRTFFDESASVEEYLAEQPGAVRTDAQGIAKIPIPKEQSLRITAAHSGRLVQRTVEKDEKSLEIELLPPRGVRVLVEHADGRPASGVPVALAKTREDEPKRIVLLALRTDDRGQAWFPELPGDGVAIPESNPSLSPYVVALAYPTQETPERVVRRVGDEVRFTLPPTASLRGHITLDDGGAAPDGTRIVLTNAGSTKGPSHYLCSAATHDGVVEFPYVAPGIGVMAMRSLPGEPVVWGPKSCTYETRSPDDPGVTGEFEWKIEIARRSVLRGRAVTETGEPLGDVKPLLKIANWGTRILSTKADGTFETALDGFDRSAPGVASAGLEIQCVLGERTALARVGLPALPSRIIDAGNLVFDSKPVLAQGVVRDSAGVPQSGEIVAVVKRNAETSLLEMASPYVYPTDDMGQFTIDHSPEQADSLLVVQRGFDFVGEPIPYRAASDLVLIIPATARLNGRLELDPEIPRKRLRVEFWDESRGTAPGLGVMGWEICSVEDDGSFRSGSLRPGRYTVAISGPGLANLFAKVEGVEIRERETRDPRFLPFDLRGRLRWIELDVEDESGKSLRAQVFAKLANRGRIELGGSDRPIVLAQDAGLESLTIRADGLLPATLGPVEGHVKVVLTRGVDVTIEWGGGALPDAPIRVLAEIRASGTNGRGEPLKKAAFAPNGLVRLAVPSAGDYELAVAFEQLADGRLVIAPLTDREHPLLVTVNADGSTRFPFAPSVAVVEQALAKFKDAK